MNKIYKTFNIITKVIVFCLWIVFIIALCSFIKYIFQNLLLMLN